MALGAGSQYILLSACWRRTFNPEAGSAIRCNHLSVRPARPGAHCRRQYLGRIRPSCPAVDQRGGASLSAAIKALDPLPLAARSDVVVFQSEPLQRDLEVTGPITVSLWVSSSAPDTDFTVKLIDVYPTSADYPDGYALNLTDSIMRLRFRDSFTKPELMAPNEVYQLRFPLYPTSNVFKGGHRIRVDISTSNFPRFDVNPNTGGPLGEPGGIIVADNTIHHDSDRPSHIVLPVINV